jgi:hypothetical protein
MHFKKFTPTTPYSGTALRKNWNKDNGLYFFGGDRLYIPNIESLRMDLLHDHHDTPTAGHQGFQRTMEKLKKNFFWESLREDCMKYVLSCDSCQRIKAANRSPAELLHSLPIPEERFQVVCIDFAEMPTSNDGFDFCLVLVDKLTRLVKLIPTTKTVTASRTAQLFLDHWYCSGKGAPRTIISDRGQRFISDLWKSFTKQLDTNVATRNRENISPPEKYHHP